MMVGKDAYRPLLWTLVLSLTVLLALAGCQPKGTPVTMPATTEPPSPPQPEAVTLLWGFWGSPEEKASHERVANAFMKEHPGIQIAYFHEPWNSYFEKLNTRWAAGDYGSIPDVFFLWPTPAYAAKGVLENLEPWIQKSGYDVDDYWPFLLDSARYQGDVYGLPRDIEAHVLYYNKKVFDEAGVAYPTDDWTWDDFLAAAEKLTVKDSSGRVTRYALGMEGGKWAHWVGQAGGQVLDDLVNPSRCTLDTPESMKGIQFFADLINKGYAMRAATLNQQGGDAAVFEAGQVATIIQNPSRVSTFNANPNLDYDVAAVPIPAGGQRWNPNGGAAWVMSAHSKHKEEAWLFLSWLQSKGGGQSIYTRAGEISPALRSVAGSPEFLNLGQPANRKAFVIAGEAARPGAFGYFPEWDELSESIINPQLERIWAGEATPQEVIPGLCQAVNEFLKQNGYPR